MSYALADGTMSTDYKLGDRFKAVSGADEGTIWTFEKDDGTSLPWFTRESSTRHRSERWANLVALNKGSKNTRLIKQLRKAVKELEDTIKELEQ